MVSHFPFWGNPPRGYPRKPNNESKVVFHDSIPKKTPYSILYLHGFSASTEEGNPVHINIANALGANIYLPRLFGHGLVEEEPIVKHVFTRGV